MPFRSFGTRVDLAPVGILLAIGGYALGIYAGVLCATLLRWVHLLVG